MLSGPEATSYAVDSHMDIEYCSGAYTVTLKVGAQVRLTMGAGTTFAYNGRVGTVVWLKCDPLTGLVRVPSRKRGLWVVIHAGRDKAQCARAYPCPRCNSHG